MNQKLSKAPVYYTLAQVQFNPVLDLDNFLPAIQSQMRESAFPDYKPEVFQRLIMPFAVGDGAQVTPPGLTRQSRYWFGDIAGRTSFLLETNGLTLQTTEYPTFEEFRGIFLTGLGVVHKALRLDFVERIGLRYLDAVYPLSVGESLDDYLVPEVRGLSGKIEGHMLHAATETMAMTAAGQLVSRTIIRQGRIGVPDDFSTNAPQINPRFTEWEGLHAIVDTDAFQMRREAFDLDAVKTQLGALHNVVKTAFKATVTDHARKAWA
jgi:uncharacterized protein (TIGR04255 family)